MGWDWWSRRPGLIAFSVITVLILPPMLYFTKIRGGIGVDFRVYRHAMMLDLDSIYDQRIGFLFFNPPTTIPFFKLLTFLPISLGYAAYAAIGACLFVAATRQLEGKALIVALGSPVWVHCLVQGQISMILGSLVIMGCQQGGMVSGALMGLALAMKPQLALLAPLALLVRKDWRAIAGMAIAGLGVLALEFTLFGMQLWIDWFRALRGLRHFLETYQLMWINVTPSGIAVNLGLPTWPAYLTGIALGVAVVLRSAKLVDGLELAALITVASLLSGPYAAAYDLIAVLPFAATLMLQAGIRAPVVAALFVLTMWLAPIGILTLAVMWIWRWRSDGTGKESFQMMR